MWTWTWTGARATRRTVGIHTGDVHAERPGDVIEKVPFSNFKNAASDGMPMAFLPPGMQVNTYSPSSPAHGYVEEGMSTIKVHGSCWNQPSTSASSANATKRQGPGAVQQHSSNLRPPNLATYLRV